MKYSDEQRIQKILEYSQKLMDYIITNGITSMARNNPIV